MFADGLRSCWRNPFKSSVIKGNQVGPDLRASRDLRTGSRRLVWSGNGALGELALPFLSSPRGICRRDLSLVALSNWDGLARPAGRHSVGGERKVTRTVCQENIASWSASSRPKHSPRSKREPSNGSRSFPVDTNRMFGIPAAGATRRPANPGSLRPAPAAGNPPCTEFAGRRKRNCWTFRDPVAGRTWCTLRAVPSLMHFGRSWAALTDSEFLPVR
jgi:hypothetical protein